jgi:hypothetical protein
LRPRLASGDRRSSAPDDPYVAGNVINVLEAETPELIVLTAA